MIIHIFLSPANFYYMIIQILCLQNIFIYIFNMNKFSVNI